MKPNDALQELLSRPRPERARYAKALIDSLDAPQSDDNYDETWVDEIERRVADSKQRPEALVEWSQVRARIDARLRKS